jgi:hypothetical protein
MSRKNFSTQNPLYKRVFSLVFALFLVWGTLAFVGCDNGPEPFSIGGNGNITPLIGTWEDSTFHDQYVITATTIFYDTDGGDIKYISDFGSNSGVIIYEYETAKTNGRKFGAVYYRELKTEGGVTSAKISTAALWTDSGTDSDGDGYNEYVDTTPAIKTLDDAIPEFSVDKGDGYYVSAWGGPYVKQ